MESIDIKTALATVEKLEISETTVASEASAVMKMLGEFNQCAIGLASFCGLTPWERHPDDELLYILEGDVDITVLLENGEVQKLTLHAGSIFTIPRDLWHNQNSSKGTKLLFLTSQQGNEVSMAQDPRVRP